MRVFVHLSKSGGTTVTYILRSTYGLRHCQVEPWHARWTGPPFSIQDLERLRKLYPNLRSIAGHRVTGYVDLGDDGDRFDYFTMIRDPVKSSASHYQYKKEVSGKKIAFEDWIQQDWTRNPATKQIAGVDDVNEAIRIIEKRNMFVGLAEHFDESMVLLKRLRFNELNISYKRVNVASSNAIKERLLSTERTREMIAEAHAADLQLYDYVKQELLEGYRREYGASLEADVAEFLQTQSGDFNYRNLTLSRMKHYGLYKPLLELHRRRRAAV